MYFPSGVASTFGYFLTLLFAVTIFFIYNIMRCQEKLSAGAASDVHACSDALEEDTNTSTQHIRTESLSNQQRKQNVIQESSGLQSSQTLAVVDEEAAQEMQAQVAIEYTTLMIKNETNANDTTAIQDMHCSDAVEEENAHVATEKPLLGQGNLKQEASGTQTHIRGIAEEEAAQEAAVESMSKTLIRRNETNQNENEITTQILPARLHYLDNLKVFLTWLVVTHHIASAFGAAGSGSWVFIVGINDNSFRTYLGKFLQVNQAFFMPLFFFISGYFSPSSYDKRSSMHTHISIESIKRMYLLDKWKRYGRPAVWFTFVAAPLLLIFCQWYMGKKYFYIALPMQCWFLYWLLFFNLAYGNVRKCQEYDAPQRRIQETDAIHSNNDNRTLSSSANNQELRKMPGPLKRTFVYGAGVCGGVMFLVMIMLGVAPTILGAPTLLAGMPIVKGSLVNNILFFGAGIVAQKHKWLEHDLKPQLGMKCTYLYFLVLVEMVVMTIITVTPENWQVAYTFQTIVAGMFCVDASVALLVLFQEYLNFENQWSRKLSSAAYGVYVYHPIFIITATAVFVTIYNSSIGKDNPVMWEYGRNAFYSSTMLTGGSMTLAIGFASCAVFVHLIVWPAGYIFKL
jgi:hypothetical protein